MPQEDFPFVSKELLQALDKAFPNKCPGLDMPDRKIWFEVGARSVVEFLHSKHKQQLAAKGND